MTGPSFEKRTPLKIVSSGGGDAVQVNAKESGHAHQLPASAAVIGNDSVISVGPGASVGSVGPGASVGSVGPGASVASVASVNSVDPADPADPWLADALDAANGNRLAFERLYRGNTGRVYSICVRMVTDRTRAQELTQDVFVRVWQKLPTFRGDSAVSTWLHRVTVNVVLTQQKSSNAHKNQAVNDDDAIELTAGRGAFVGERIDLDAAIAGLPRGARQIFVLHDVEGFTHEEIAEQVGISPGGSKAQLHRARLLLRRALTR